MLIALAKAVEAVINKGNSITEALILPKTSSQNQHLGKHPYHKCKHILYGLLSNSQYQFKAAYSYST